MMSVNGELRKTGADCVKQPEVGTGTVVSGARRFLDFKERHQACRAIEAGEAMTGSDDGGVRGLVSA